MSDLRPCRILMGAQKFNTLARDYEAASLWLDVACQERELERMSALFLWDDVAINDGWVRP